MGLFVLAKDDSLESNLDSAICNIELHINHIGSSYLLTDFALKQLQICKDLITSEELAYKDFSLPEISEIQNETDYVFIKYHEDFTLELEGYYSTIYISKYNDNTFILNKEKRYFNCNTLKELILHINAL